MGIKAIWFNMVVADVETLTSIIKSFCMSNNISYLHQIIFEIFILWMDLQFCTWRAFVRYLNERIYYVFNNVIHTMSTQQINYPIRRHCCIVRCFNSSLFEFLILHITIIRFLIFKFKIFKVNIYNYSTLSVGCRSFW